MVLGLLGVLLLCLVWTGLELLQVRDELTEARDLLETAADVEEPEQALPHLAEARELLSRSEDRLERPGPAVVAALPVVGRTVDAARATAAAGAAAVGGGIGVLQAVPDRLLIGGRLDLAGTREVEAAVRDAEARVRGPVARLTQAELAAVPEPLAEAVREARRRLTGTPDALLRVADGLAAVQGVLGAERERRLLIVLQNNAELRATGGLVSVFTQATARDGALRLEGFQEVEAVADPPDEARPVPAPQDYERLYGPYLANTTLWKNVNMSADVPTSSSVLAEIAEATLPTAPDVVVWVDVPAIAALLRATGPVQLPDGSRLTADNAVRRLLSEAYADADREAVGQDRRQDELRAAADAVLGRLLAPGTDLSATRLARELAAATAGRHLALWSADPEEQARLVTARLAGQVRADDGDLSSFAVHNLGGGGGAGNKLDFYGRRQVSVRVEVGPEHALVEQELALRNSAPTQGLPVYVAGQDDPGTANLLVTLSAPADAELEPVHRDGQRIPVEPQPMADHLVLQDVVSIPPGQTVTWLLRYRLPLEDGRYSSTLLPQPLAVDAGLLLEVRGPAGRRLVPEPVLSSGPYDEVVHVDVQLEPLSHWARFTAAVRRFWNEPVPVPWASGAGASHDG